MAHQTFTLPASNLTLANLNRVGWTHAVFNPQLSSALVAGDDAAYIGSLQFIGSGSISNRGIYLNVASTVGTEGIGENVELTSQFENNWQMRLKHGTNTFYFDHAEFSPDPSEPYAFASPNAAARTKLTNVYNAFNGGQTDIELILWDGAGTNPFVAVVGAEAAAMALAPAEAAVTEQPADSHVVGGEAASFSFSPAVADATHMEGIVRVGAEAAAFEVDPANAGGERGFGLSDFVPPLGASMHVLALLETGTRAGGEVFDVRDNRGRLLAGDIVLEELTGGASSTFGAVRAPSVGTLMILDRTAGTMTLVDAFGAGGDYEHATVWMQFENGVVVEAGPSDLNSVSVDRARWNVANNPGWRAAIISLRTAGTRFILGLGIKAETRVVEAEPATMRFAPAVAAATLVDHHVVGAEAVAIAFTPAEADATSVAGHLVDGEAAAVSFSPAEAAATEVPVDEHAVAAEAAAFRLAPAQAAASQHPVQNHMVDAEAAAISFAPVQAPATEIPVAGHMVDAEAVSIAYVPGEAGSLAFMPTLLAAERGRPVDLLLVAPKVYRLGLSEIFSKDPPRDADGLDIGSGRLSLAFSRVERPVDGVAGEDGEGYEYCFAATAAADIAADRRPRDEWTYEGFPRTVNAGTDDEIVWHDGADRTTVDEPFLLRCQRKVAGRPPVGTVVFDPDDDRTRWSAPEVVGHYGVNGQGRETVYAATADANAPADAPDDDWPVGSPQGSWTHAAPGLSAEFPYMWASQRDVEGFDMPGEDGWETPVIVNRWGVDGEDGLDGIPGADGEDGNGVEYRFAATTDANAPALPSHTLGFDSTHATWTDGAPGVSATNAYVWTIRRRVPGTPNTGAAPSATPPATGIDSAGWSRWSMAVIVSRHADDGDDGLDGVAGADGEDGNGKEWIFAVTSSANMPSSNPLDSWAFDAPVAPWFDAAPTLSATNAYLWRCERDITGSGSTPAQRGTWSSPRIVGRWGDDGNDGLDGIAGADGTDGENGDGFEYVFLRNAGQTPSNPSNTWGYENQGSSTTWFDGAPTLSAMQHTLWRAKRKISGAPAVGEAVPANWSTPVVVGHFGDDGEDGAAGADGSDGISGVFPTPGTVVMIIDANSSFPVSRTRVVTFRKIRGDGVEEARQTTITVTKSRARHSQGSTTDGNIKITAIASSVPAGKQSLSGGLTFSSYSQQGLTQAERVLNHAASGQSIPILAFVPNELPP